MIVNPVTGEHYEITSTLGRNILKSYIMNYRKGGSKLNITLPKSQAKRSKRNPSHSEDRRGYACAGVIRDTNERCNTQADTYCESCRGFYCSGHMFSSRPNYEPILIEEYGGNWKCPYCDTMNNFTSSYGRAYLHGYGIVPAGCSRCGPINMLGKCIYCNEHDELKKRMSKVETKKIKTKKETIKKTKKNKKKRKRT